jgi:hypothetical protein
MIDFWALRSKGPTVSSPVREGGVDATVSCLSAEGAPRFCDAPSGLWVTESWDPRLTDGATNCQSFGPKAARV